ncbi:glycosyltransferase [Metaplanococcus flavidus]|uniref:Glycosyltransferase n=1 Tax=Metaplanococcus flavidus TaxID=569883 RepID=A0ABW3LBM6_9BACL
MKKEILVSIDCLTYNHGDYIAETIEGFLMQKTDFNFEILIHDDASTDHTAEVIDQYVKKFPDMIKPIYQKENQFSQGIEINQVNEQRAKGKYVALCEGDDYWTDPYKLQKQVNYMETNPQCSLCVHAAYRFSELRKKIISRVRPSRQDRIFSADEIIEGGGELFPTNSMMYRREIAGSMPAFYLDTGIGDYPLAVHLAHNGAVYYIDEVMSVYRVDVKGSWSERKISDFNAAVLQNEETAKLLDAINGHTNFQYDETITRTKRKNRFYLLLRQHKFKEAFIKEHKEFYLNSEFIRRAGMKVFNLPVLWKNTSIHLPRKAGRLPN